MEEELGMGRSTGLGGVTSGDCQIFLCQGAQGGRGRSAVERTFGRGADLE